MAAWRGLGQHAMTKRLREKMLHAPLESILHASRKRLKWLGAVAHGAVFSVTLPVLQPDPAIVTWRY